MTRSPALVAALAVALLAAEPAAAASPSAGLRVKPIATGLRSPIALTAPQGSRHDVYVAERAGRILLIRRGKRRRSAFLDIRSAVSSFRPETEEGFLSFAFAPGFRRNRRLYVSYASTRGTQVLEEWRANRAGTRVVRGSRRTLIELDHPEPHHFGGDLHFGPDDKLYYSVGDGAVAHGTEYQGRVAQNLARLQGKILRIDPRPAANGAPYRIPRGNPFSDTPGARPEIWLYGVRNPWRFSFDPPTGDLIIGDVGDEQREEVDWLHGPRAGRGANLGWPCREGTIAFHHAYAGCSAPGAVRPVFDYGHFPQSDMPSVRPGQRIRPPQSGGVHAAHMAHGCTGSVTGGYVSRDPQLKGLRGRYVFAEFCAGWLMRGRLRGGRMVVHAIFQRGRFQQASFGVDGCRRLYVLDINGSRVSRLQGKRSRCVRPRGR